jgi:hypothetical protein
VCQGAQTPIHPLSTRPLPGDVFAQAPALLSIVAPSHRTVAKLDAFKAGAAAVAASSLLASVRPSCAQWIRRCIPRAAHPDGVYMRDHHGRTGDRDYAHPLSATQRGCPWAESCTHAHADVHQGAAPACVAAEERLTVLMAVSAHGASAAEHTAERGVTRGKGRLTGVAGWWWWWCGHRAPTR